MLLPQKAHEAVVALSELHAMFDGAAGLLADDSKPAPAQELKGLLRNLQQMTIVDDEHINKAVQSCKRARGQRLETMATVMSRKIMSAGYDDDQDEVTAHDDEPDFIESPLSQHVTRNGVTVRVDIYGDSDNRWILEIVDAENTSHVWEEHFETDQQALDEALRALDDRFPEYQRLQPLDPVCSVYKPQHHCTLSFQRSENSPDNRQMLSFHGSYRQPLLSAPVHRLHQPVATVTN